MWISFGEAIAGLVIDALMLRELERLGLVDHSGLRRAAVERARSIEPPELGASVDRVIKSIFDGKPLATPRAGLIVADGQTNTKH